MGTPEHYLTVEFQCFRREVSANVEHEEIVDMGSPQKSRCGDLFSFMHLDSVSSQDGSAHLAGCLAAVDEQNFLVGKSRAATQWRWAIHKDTPETSAPPFRKVIRPKSAPGRVGSQERNRKARNNAPMASRGFLFSRLIWATRDGCPYQSCPRQISLWRLPNPSWTARETTTTSASQSKPIGIAPRNVPAIEQAVVLSPSLPPRVARPAPSPGPSRAVLSRGQRGRQRSDRKADRPM